MCNDDITPDCLKFIRTSVCTGNSGIRVPARLISTRLRKYYPVPTSDVNNIFLVKKMYNFVQKIAVISVIICKTHFLCLQMTIKP